MLTLIREYQPLSAVISKHTTLHSLIFVMCILAISACSENLPSSKNTTKSTDPTKSIGSRVISGNPLPINASFDPDKLLVADLEKGGQLYDNWFTTLNMTSPDRINSIWNLLGHTTVETSDTWRCSSCHGWDYLGVKGTFGDITNLFHTGIKGIVPAINQISAQQIWSFIRDGSVTDANNTNAGHNFSLQLTDEDIYNLTKFIETVRNENSLPNTPLNITNNKLTLVGNQSIGAKLYNANNADSCVSCHGSSGNLLAGISVREIAASNPARTLHQIRFGIASANNPMPGLISSLAGNPTLSLQQAGDITTFAAHGLDANHIRGGRLYDDWIIESGIDTTTLTPNPLWDIAAYPELIPVGFNTDPVQSWRCVSCHTYYYEGGNGFEFNNLLDLKEARGWTIDNAPDSFNYLYEFLSSGFLANINGTITRVHNYGQFINTDPTLTTSLADTDLWDLADFLVEETIVTDRYILPDVGTASGGPGRPANFLTGLEYYTNTQQLLGTEAINCSMCHGLDGLGITNVDLAALAWDDPWMFLHRTRFGTPRLPDATIAAPFDSTASVMPGILEFTKQDGLTLSDNDDAMHVLYYSQLELNGFTPP